MEKKESIFFNTKITRRQVLGNSFRLVVASFAFPTFYAFPQWKENLIDTSIEVESNLVQDAIISGSSFAGIVNKALVKIETENYYTTISDRNPTSWWTPMEEKGPHWLELRWRYPIQISELRMSSKEIRKSSFLYWANNRFNKLCDGEGKDFKTSFDAIMTDRIRLEINEFISKPIIYDIFVGGPLRIPVPKEFPTVESPNELFMIIDSKFDKEIYKPGDIIDFSIQINASMPISVDSIFIVEIREKGINDLLRKRFGDFEVVGVSIQPEVNTSAWKVYSTQVLTGKITLPYYAPSGKTSISVSAISFDGSRFIPVINRSTGTSIVRSIEIQRSNDDVSVEEHPKVKIDQLNGQSGFKIGSRFTLPFMNRYMTSVDFERLYDSKANGIDIQYFLMYSSCITANRKWEDYILRLDQQIVNSLRVRPESYFMIGMDFRASKDWLRANPSERMLNRDGKLIVHKKFPYGLVSYGSEKYLQDCYAFIKDTITFIKSKPYAGRVIGYYPYACSQNDAFIGGTDGNLLVSDRSNIYVGDFHKGVIKKYQDWLRTKYSSVDELRKAWRDEKADFKRAEPNGQNLVKEDLKSSVFRNVIESRAAIDYIEFFPTLIGGFYQKLSAYYKELTDNKALVFMNYGAVISTLSRIQPSGARYHANNNDFGNLLRDKNIDMFVQSMPYDKRSIDDPIIFYQPIKSIVAHGKVYLSDYDARTFTSGTLMHGRHRSQHETRAIIQRDLSWLMIKNAGAWLADMSNMDWRSWNESRNPWFSKPVTTTAVKDTLEIFNKRAKPKSSLTQIVVVLDIDGVPYEDALNSAVIYHNLLTEMVQKEFTVLSAPYDIVLKSDLCDGKIEDEYKLYVFVNCFCLNEDERKAINRLKKVSGRTFLWFYAPGYLSKTGADIAAMKSLIGMNVQIKENISEKLQMKVVNSSHVLTDGLLGTSFSADLSDNTKHVHPEEINPVFYINDSKVTTLAVYPDGKTAWAVCEYEGVKSIYCAVPYLDKKAFRNIVKFAEVHLYTKEDIVMNVDNGFLMFSNGYKAKRKLEVFLPESKTVRDAFTGEILAQDIVSFTLDMNCPDTRILSLE